ncbi:hypothetical protein KC675_03585 [Candidatus Dojkabacteria bacterium]|uniref:Uncharacterized protein n=1 Tax=Candidatus Dojkabacteria bacterium TaxID=2099670 RepID=A0A955I911_9BACT|nr:hypothetical protein [Candidatus Dojkabacteria bacterium]
MAIGERGYTEPDPSRDWETDDGTELGAAIQTQQDREFTLSVQTLGTGSDPLPPEMIEKANQE